MATHRTLAALLLAGLSGCAPPPGQPFGLSRGEEPADTLVFNNGVEPEYIDPGQATGHPDGRIIGELFDGLLEYDPVDLSPRPAHAESWTRHPDGRGYTFHLRRDATWTDGAPVTAHDYAWSWERLLNAVYLSRYAQQIYAVRNAAAYNQGRLFRLRQATAGLPAGVAVLTDGDHPLLNERSLRRATAGFEVDDTVVITDVLEDGQVRVYDGFRERWVEVDEGDLRPSFDADTIVEVEVVDETEWHPTPAEPDAAPPDPDAPAPPTGPDAPEAETAEAAPPQRIQVRAGDLLQTRDLLGLRAVDDYTFEVRLEGVAPYFLQQACHTSTRAVPRQAIETHGRRWTRPENIVSSGGFRLVEHKVRDKFVMEKWPDHWDAHEIRLNRIIAYSVDNPNTSANLYRAGYTDLVVANDLPPEFLPILEGRPDYTVTPALTVYYYRLNTDEPPLDDPRVRRALAMAIDRNDIVKITKAGELPANHLVPPGLPGYTPAEGPDFDPAAAKALLAEAGFPDGAGMPTLRILYNTQEKHKLIAAVIQDHWRRHLGVNVELENREWKTYLKAVDAKDYMVARAGWIGDYLDPNTFLEMWITGGGNNKTGWSSPEYDALIHAAARQADPSTRMATLAQAEAILNEEMPIIPMYWYVWQELRQPDLRGHHPNQLDHHPLRHVWIDRDR